MDLIKTLEKAHSKTQRDKMVNYIGADPERFAELITILLQGPYRITQRASWPLSICIEKHPTLIKPHLKKILAQLHKPNQHDAVKRNIIRLLQYVEIPVGLQGAVVDICFQFLSDTKEPVAIRAFAITVLTTMTQKVPELKNELIALIEQHLPYEQPAFVSRGNRALRELKKI